MRRLVYWGCAIVMAISGLGSLIPVLLTMAGQSGTPLHLLSSLFGQFATVVPNAFAYFVPQGVKLAIVVLIQLLVVRRVWLLVARGQRQAPDSFRGFPMTLGYIGLASLLLGVAGLGISIALKAGSGVPAGMLLLPAVFCIPWAFFLTEVLSFRTAGDAGDTLPLEDGVTGPSRRATQRRSAASRQG